MKSDAKPPQAILHERQNYIFVRIGYTTKEMGIDSSGLQALTDKQFKDFVETFEKIEDGEPFEVQEVW